MKNTNVLLIFVILAIIFSALWIGSSSGSSHSTGSTMFDPDYGGSVFLDPHAGSSPSAIPIPIPIPIHGGGGGHHPDPPHPHPHPHPHPPPNHNNNLGPGGLSPAQRLHYINTHHDAPGGHQWPGEH